MHTYLIFRTQLVAEQLIETVPTFDVANNGSAATVSGSGGTLHVSGRTQVFVIQRKVTKIFFKATTTASIRCCILCRHEQSSILPSNGSAMILSDRGKNCARQLTECFLRNCCTEDHEAFLNEAAGFLTNALVKAAANAAYRHDLPRAVWDASVQDPSAVEGDANHLRQLPPSTVVAAASLWDGLEKYSSTTSPTAVAVPHHAVTATPADAVGMHSSGAKKRRRGETVPTAQSSLSSSLDVPMATALSLRCLFHLQQTLATQSYDCTEESSPQYTAPRIGQLNLFAAMRSVLLRGKKMDEAEIMAVLAK